jgi:hypothetical protein
VISVVNPDAYFKKSTVVVKVEAGVNVSELVHTPSIVAVI